MAEDQLKLKCIKCQDSTGNANSNVVMTTVCRKCFKEAKKHVVHTYYNKNVSSNCNYCPDKENSRPATNNPPLKSVVNIVRRRSRKQSRRYK